MEPYIHKVQYYETDMMGIAHHSRFVLWMEEARVDFMDRLGFPYARMEEEGVLSPVKSVSCDYKKPARFGDEIAIRVCVESFGGLVLAIRYGMTNRDGETVCLARSEHVFLNRERQIVRPRKIMPEFCAAIEAVLASQAAETDPGTGK